MDLSAILISQYLASLEMLKQTITMCPDSMWNAESDKNKFWQVAYHALFFVHEYLQESAATAVPWPKHRHGYEDFPAPEGGEPYDKETLLEYLAFCQQEVVGRVPQLKLEAPEGFGDDLITMELQIFSLRHLMQHTGELMERVGAQTGAEIDWVGWVHGYG